MSGQRFLVIGSGSIGRRHISNLISLGIKDLLVYDASEARRTAVASELGIRAASSLEEAWSQKPQAAFITVPTSLHIPLALEAARKNCHLFVEKPLAHNLEGVQELLDEVRERSLITLVGCNMRFHPGLRKVYDLLRTGKIGKVVSIRAEAGQYLPDWHPKEDYRLGYSAKRAMGGGVILDAIHEIDYVRWLMRQEIGAVSCFAGKLSDLEIETEDVAAILLAFSSGAIGEIHMDYVQRAYSRNCHVIGDEGTIRWDFAKGETSWFIHKEGRWQTEVQPAGWNLNQMYKDEMEHFLRCLDGLEKPSLDVFDAHKVLEAALAAKASSENNFSKETVGGTSWR